MGRITSTSQCLLPSDSAISGKAKGEVHVKMGRTQFCGPDKKVKGMIEKLARNGEAMKEIPSDALSECNLDGSFNSSCDIASSKKEHYHNGSLHKDGDDFLEVRRASIYRSTKLQKKFRLEDPKKPKGEKKVDGQRNLKDRVLDGPNCAQKHEMHGIHELQREADEIFIRRKPSEKHSNGLMRERKLETDDLIRHMSNLPDYLQSRERGESFQEKALNFGVLNWTLLEKWNRNQGRTRSRRSFHSPSGSDTSSSFSTLESSSFSCRSEISPFARRERSPSNSLHSYLNSASVSIINSHCLSQPSSPCSSQQRHALSVDGLRHGSEEISTTNPPLKTDNESPCNEYLEFKLLEGKIVENRGSEVEKISKDTSVPLEKEISFSDLKSLEHSYPTGIGVDIEKEDCRSETEHGVNSGFELPEEQWVSGLSTPGFYSAGDRSPETWSEMSLHSEDTLPQSCESTGYSTVIASTQGGSLEDDVNIQFVDCYDELSAANADSGSIQAGDPALTDERGALVCGSSLQKATSYISLSSGSNNNHLCSDDNKSVSQAVTQKSLLPKNLTFPIHDKLSNSSEIGDHLKPGSNDVLFCRSQSVIHDKLQQDKEGIGMPVKSAAGSYQLQPETVVREGSPASISKTRRNVRPKSFSVSASQDFAVNNLESASMTPKSFSVRTDVCSCHSGFKDKCKVCKKVSASPLRRLIDPIVKSRERHRMDSSTSAPLVDHLLHHDNDANGGLNSRIGVRMDKPLRRSLAWSFPGPTHKASRSSSVKSIPSESQPFMASENDISSRQFVPVSRSICSSPETKHEHILEKLSESTLETDVSCSCMPAPPARPPILQGLLHFVYKNGLPYFTFSLNESEDVLAAKTWKIDKTDREDFDWMYTFHSGQSINKKRNKHGWVNWGRKNNHIPDIVGKMKVSCSLCSKSNSSSGIEHLVETEFVLFDANIGNAKESPATQVDVIDKSSFCPSQSSHSRDSYLNKEFSDSFSTSTRSSTPMSHYITESLIPRSMTSKHVDRKKEAHVLRYPFRHFSESSESSMRSRSAGENSSCQASWNDSGILDSEMCLSSHFWPHLELAALVIRVPVERRESVKGGLGEETVTDEAGGWGLKFLEKTPGSSRAEVILDCLVNLSPPELVGSSQSDSCKAIGTAMEDNDISVLNSIQSAARHSFANCSLENLNTSLSCEAQGHTSVTVIVPAGRHGLPTTESSGPSSLIERWKSGGRCDCGGWDLGCSLSVLDNQKRNRHASIEANDNAEDYHPSDVFIQGAKQGMPALSLAVVHDGLYLLSFQPKLSALQAFSIGVAMLHSRDPFVSTKENNNLQESNCRSLHIPVAKQVKTLSQAISTPQDDIVTKIHRTHDTLSVSYVPDPPLSPFGRV